MTVADDLAALTLRVTAAETRLDQAATLLTNTRNRVSTLEGRNRALGRLYRRLRGRGLVHGDPDAEPDPDDVIDIKGGHIRYGDIPLNAQGTPTSAWLLDNCLCAAHTKMRLDMKPKRITTNLPVEPKPEE